MISIDDLVVVLVCVGVPLALAVGGLMLRVGSLTARVDDAEVERIRLAARCDSLEWHARRGAP